AGKLTLIRNFFHLSTGEQLRTPPPMKTLHFRSIAPKAPAVVPCPPAVSETPAAANAKSVLVPTQNFALMQVAGQEGTFSLVPLAASPQHQPITKLPIPRYQPVKSKTVTEKPSSRKAASPTKVATMTQAEGPSSTEPPANETVDSEVKDHLASGLLRPSESAPKHTAAVTDDSAQIHPNAAQPITVLSPALFSKAVQLIPPPPTGKVPILPYARVKDSLLSTPPFSKPPNHDQGRPTAAKKNLAPEPQAPLNSHKGHKRGRKRKTMEDILAFEARKKRSLTFFRRKATQDKPPVCAPATSDSKDNLMDICKKYRSIRPKPVLIEATPTLLGLPALSTADGGDQELLPGSSGKGLALSQAAVAQRGLFVSSRPQHCCPTCGRCFQFKHHLQSHMISHSNLRPYTCPVCRKAYAHSGSLSTHMKEVHKVILTVEPSNCDYLTFLSPWPRSGSAEQADDDRVDPVELQIKCGRCQAITPTFSDMKLHLLYVHGEEVQLRLREGGVVRAGREAEDELVKHAAHYWRQLSEKRSMVKCGCCDQEFLYFSRLKRHLVSHHQGEAQLTADGQKVKEGEPARGGAKRSSLLRTEQGLRCFLCSETLEKKQEVLDHWSERHNCENPTLLWEVLDAGSDTNSEKAC
uniref:C2H2-type domain-containing protein n=1 Tax=Denticeps clupeoides TaxID=299321 RepID=A0AAY4AC95_9TELE